MHCARAESEVQALKFPVCSCDALAMLWRCFPLDLPGNKIANLFNAQHSQAKELGEGRDERQLLRAATRKASSSSRPPCMLSFICLCVHTLCTARKLKILTKDFSGRIASARSYSLRPNSSRFKPKGCWRAPDKIAPPERVDEFESLKVWKFQSNCVRHARISLRCLREVPCSLPIIGRH